MCVQYAQYMSTYMYKMLKQASPISYLIMVTHTYMHIYICVCVCMCVCICICCVSVCVGHIIILWETLEKVMKARFYAKFGNTKHFHVNICSSDEKWNKPNYLSSNIITNYYQFLPTEKTHSLLLLNLETDIFNFAEKLNQREASGQSLALNTAKTPTYKAWNTFAEYPSCECNHNTRVPRQ